MRIRVASAGTGKTASLVVRFLQAVSEGVPLRRIAGITFTRKAADELRLRVGAALEQTSRGESLLGFTPNPSDLWRFSQAQLELSGSSLSTIHAFMGQCLRHVAPLLFLDPDFEMLGEWEAKGLFLEEVRSLAYLATAPDHPLFQRFEVGHEEALLHLFSRRSLALNFSAAAGAPNAALMELYQSVLASYRQRLGQRFLSAADLELRATEMLQNPQAVERLKQRYKLVLVDEFQDVNPLQGHFIRQLEGSGVLVEAVGDPKQSIYAFRYADIEVFRLAMQQGEVLPPLNQSYRHSRVVLRFLNRLSQFLASDGRGFSGPEAPVVEGLRPEVGKVELHWVIGSGALDEMRRYEAQVLASRLKALSAKYRLDQMAVLIRSRSSLPILEEGLAGQGLDYVLVQGRGLYQKLEIRDLFHAIKTALNPQGLSLAAWLRGPFAQLSLTDTDFVLKSEQPLHTLQTHYGPVWLRLRLMQERLQRETPLDALRFLLHEPMIDGERYLHYLSEQAKENLDHLQFQLAAHPPASHELLLERLELLSQQTEAGDVPQSGSGVQVLTVHAAKGLEWPVVAIFDSGRRWPNPSAPLYIGPQGQVALPQTPEFEGFKEQWAQREQQENFRLLYVACSRAKDVLLLSGSVRERSPEGWAGVFDEMQLGAEQAEFDRPDFLLRTWVNRPPVAANPVLPPTRMPPATWAQAVFAAPALPPVFSPSAYKHQVPHEPLVLPDADEGELIPGKSRAIGTLVHYAIGQNWHPQTPQHLANLEAQEVMFPFDPDERLEIMSEVTNLLLGYYQMLGSQLPYPRHEDFAEYPMALALGKTVWQGIIDRLYRVGSQWFLEDYKTDTEMLPERYALQLALYREAVRQAWGINPQVRLVYLRFKQVVALSDNQLALAVAEVNPAV